MQSEIEENEVEHWPNVKPLTKSHKIGYYERMVARGNSSFNRVVRK